MENNYDFLFFCTCAWVPTFPSKQLNSILFHVLFLWSPRLCKRILFNYLAVEKRKQMKILLLTRIEKEPLKIIRRRDLGSIEILLVAQRFSFFMLSKGMWIDSSVLFGIVEEISCFCDRKRKTKEKANLIFRSFDQDCPLNLTHTHTQKKKNCTIHYKNFYMLIISIRFFS